MTSIGRTPIVFSLLLLVAWTVNATSPSDCGRRTLNSEDLTEDRQVEFLTTGDYINNTEVPWHVAIYGNLRDKMVKDEYICGGSLITDRFVLTAAHCIWDAALGIAHSYTRFKVQAGAYRSTLQKFTTNKKEALPVQLRQLSNIFTPPDYPNANGHNVDGDLALLLLQERIVFEWYIRPICLPFTRNELYPFSKNSGGIVAGWGYPRKETSKSADLKVMKDVTLHDLDGCYEALAKMNMSHLVTDKTVCADFTYHQSMCKGDDGGALALPRLVDDREVFHVYAVVGDVAQLNPDCDYGVYTVLACVQCYSEWILNTLATVD